MADRLQDLLRQRALIQEHLGWLDRQISEALSGQQPAATRGATNAAPPAATPLAPSAIPVVPAASTAVPPLPHPVASPPADADAAVILSQYQQEASTLKVDTKRGCLLYFVVGMLLMCGSVYGIYLLYIS